MEEIHSCPAFGLARNSGRRVPGSLLTFSSGVPMKLDRETPANAYIVSESGQVYERGPLPSCRGGGPVFCAVAAKIFTRVERDLLVGMRESLQETHQVSATMLCRVVPLFSMLCLYVLVSGMQRGSATLQPRHPGWPPTDRTKRRLRDTRNVQADCGGATRRFIGPPP